MKFINLIIFILYISSISCLERSLYLGKERCFYDNYYTSMNIVITYKILDKDVQVPKASETPFRITLQSENGQYFKTFYGTKLTGKFAYSFEESDKYKICIISTDKDLYKNKKFLLLQFRVQSNDELYDENSANAKDFKKVNDTMTKLNSKVDSIEYMQKYQLEVEDEFSEKQIHSSSRMAILSVCQIVIICVVGLYHVIYLRKIFKDKIWTPF